MKNMKFNFNHEKLGNLTAIISSGENAISTSNIIPITFLIENKHLDTLPFIYQLYMVYAKGNDALANIIGEYFDMEKIPFSNEEIVANINSRYAQERQQQQLNQEKPLSKNDGVLASIVRQDNPEDYIYTATISIKEKGGNLHAYVESQETLVQFQKQGLMTKMLTEYLPLYCASNNLTAITLEAGAIGGIDKATLERIYTSLGFEKQGDKLVRPVELEQSNSYDGYSPL